MGHANQCDRCGEFYGPHTVKIGKHDVNTIGIVKKGTHGFDMETRKYYDLCPCCMKSFHSWLIGEGEENGSC